MRNSSAEVSVKDRTTLFDKEKLHSTYRRGEYMASFIVNLFNMPLTILDGGHVAITM
ncbi:hypothetical protein [Sphingobacterium suaedae]|uniref:Uncharacterized protein n=1 Tax=Sphingobacterium suaedae TaxID=1686402 RepID=A0ABW5KQ41_9SPHI